MIASLSSNYPSAFEAPVNHEWPFCCVVFPSPSCVPSFLPVIIQKWNGAEGNIVNLAVNLSPTIPDGSAQCDADTISELAGMVFDK